MENVTNDSLQTIRLGGKVSETIEQFGPLTDLIGTWYGNKGWNQVAVPNKYGGFSLLVQPYTETLTITPLGTPTPNRGRKITQEVPTLMYNLTIHSNNDGSLLHAENGTWLFLTDCQDGFNIARLASIPHGNSILALGSTSVIPFAPSIQAISTLPITGPGNIPLGYTDPYLNAHFTGFNVINPNETLVEAIKEQKIISSTNLVISTANQGGINNIPFVSKNANTTKFEAIFWIETVLNPKTGNHFLQLQYSQTTILEFIPQFNDSTKLIQWPHVNINTMIKQ